MTLPLGAKLGPYEIADLIGRGGMGEVYRARDVRLGRDVAIKILPEHLSAHSDALARFRREGRAVAALSHPNIVALFDIGDSPEGPYVVTELLEGETLRSRLLRGALPMEEALRIAAAIAEGLGAAHGKGIIHRDLKPENVILTAGGGVKILDFGLASRQRPLDGAAAVNPTSQTEALTEPGLVIGTIGYMAPEQLRGRPLTTACDVFALGCVTFEMLRAEMPFQRESNIEVIAAVLRDEPLDRVGADLPSEVRAVLSGCLEKDPDKRYPNGTEVAAAMREVLRKHDAGHLSTMKTMRVRHRFAPSRMLLGVVGLVVLIGVLAVLWSSLAARREVIDNGYDLRAADISASADVRRLIALALRADAAGDRPEAIELCREAARLDTHAPLAAAFLASFLFNNGDPRQGMQWSSETKRRLGGAASATYETMLSRYLMPENEGPGEMALAASMLELRPSAWRLRLALAHQHLSRRELPAALAQLKLIDVSRPDDRRLTNVLADRASLGDIAGATRDLERSRLSQRPPLLAFTRGRIAWSRGDATEAVRQFENAVEDATTANLPSIAVDGRVLGGIARIGLGDLPGAQAALDLASVKAHAQNPPVELDADVFSAYVAELRGDREGMRRRLALAVTLAAPGTSAYAELRLFSLRNHAGVALPGGTPSPDADLPGGVESLIAAREAWSRGDAADSERLLRRSRAEGIDSTWFAEEAALLDYDRGGPPHPFKADPPYPNRLRYIAIWELGRARATPQYDVASALRKPEARKQKPER
jgi:tetratricopeptide (TPR) repeat protein